MLNFQKPFPRVGVSFNCKEKNISEWSVEKDARTSVFMADMLKIKKKSSLHSMKPEA